MGKQESEKRIKTDKEMIITDLKGSFTLCRENAGVISCLLTIDALDHKEPDGGDGDDSDDG